jgi:MFS family permease
MFMFWTLSEGIVSFIVPLKIEEAGFSDTVMGIILGTSSLAGALFDLIACRIFKNTFYKRVFAVMFALCLIFPLILMQAATPLMFVLGMMVWGIYYDLRNIGNFDYVARTTEPKDNARVFGLIQVCSSIGWILGPIIVGFLVGETVGWKPFVAIYIFLGMALAFFIALYLLTGNRSAKEHKKKEKECRRGTWSEAKMMGRVATILFPSLVVIFFLNLTDAFFWSIGPLYAEHLGLGEWAGFFVTVWSLPSLILGWLAGKLVEHHGKERLAFIAQLLSAAFLIPIAMLEGSAFAVLATIFLGACFAALAWPSIQGAFADYIKEREDLAKEIEAIEDLYTNLGYVFGPILAGLVADTFGYGEAFSLLGTVVAITAVILIITRRKAIRLGKNAPAMICDV